MLYATILLAILSVSASATSQPDPFAVLREAYRARDAAAAAAAYASDAEVVYAYEGTPVETHRGTEAIRRSFETLFASVEPGDVLDLNFRAVSREGDKISGIYRLRIGASGVGFGTFDVRLDGAGRFATDRSSDATRSDFEEAAGPVMLAADDEVLDPAYYDQLTGRYRLADGCTIVVTRSSVRLFARNICTQDFRGLNRLSGRLWTAGDAVLPKAETARYAFASIAEGKSPSLEVTTAGAASVTAKRDDAYGREDVVFASGDGTQLGATVYVPKGPPQRHPALVIVHGSGPQERNGYASIMAVLADDFASRGWVVLVYDKRGVGASSGDWSRAGFDVLGADARAAMAFLAKRGDVDPARIGLAGSSQAGWVLAQAIRDGAAPSHVVLLGAAGTALSVPEQNLYNTEVRMRCSGIGEADIALALAQQRAFFAFLKDPAQAPELDRLTAQARQRPALAEWLFPSSAETDRNGGAWYTTLDLAFDPLPVWRGYRGEALFLLAEHDDSTPTAVAAERLKSAGLNATVLAGAQHLGLRTDGVCKGELGDVAAFVPALFEALAGVTR